jgi:hypothetical protein
VPLAATRRATITRCHAHAVPHATAARRRLTAQLACASADTAWRRSPRARSRASRSVPA